MLTRNPEPQLRCMVAIESGMPRITNGSFFDIMIGIAAKSNIRKYEINCRLKSQRAMESQGLKIMSTSKAAVNIGGRACLQRIELEYRRSICAFQKPYRQYCFESAHRFGLAK